MLGAQMIEYNNYELHYNLWVEVASNKISME